MGNTKEVWLIVADSESARLLRASATQHGHVHLDEASSCKTTFITGEQHRPTRLSQPGRSGPTGHDHDAKNSHFAAELAPWIAKELQTRNIARCTFFAPSHLLGALRKSTGKDLAGKLVETEGELARLPAAELSRHPRIVGLLPS